MGQSTEELRAEIEQTRQSMTSDVDALQDKVSPTAIVERRKQAARSRVLGVRDKVMGTAHSATLLGVRHGRLREGLCRPVPSTRSRAPPHDTVSGAQDKVQGSPLAAGLVAFGAGMIVSALIPASEKEAVAAGHVVDAAKEHGQPVVDQAKSVAQDVAQDVKETATQAAQEVKDTRHGQRRAREVRGPVRGGRGPLADPVLIDHHHEPGRPSGRPGVARVRACGATGERDAQGDHADAQAEVQPVVGGVERDEVGLRLLVDDQAVEAQHEVDDATADEEAACGSTASGPGPCRRRRTAGARRCAGSRPGTAPQLGVRLVAGAVEAVVRRRDARDEPEDPDEQERGADQGGCCLDGRALAGAWGRMRGVRSSRPVPTGPGGTRHPTRRSWGVRRGACHGL